MQHITLSQSPAVKKHFLICPLHFVCSKIYILLSCSYEERDRGQQGNSIFTYGMATVIVETFLSCAETLLLLADLFFSDLSSFLLLSFRISQTCPYHSHPTLLRTGGKVRHRPYQF